MENLQIHNLSELLKVAQKNKIKLLSFGAAIMLATTSLTGCAASTKFADINKLEIVEVVDAIAENPILTKNDECMNSAITTTNGQVTNLNELNTLYNEGYENGNIDDCNAAVYYLGEQAIKSIIANTYGVEFSKIDITAIEVCAKESKNKTTYEYKCTFTFEGTEYVVFANNKEAQSLFQAVASAFKHELPFAIGEGTSTIDVSKAYGLVKNAVISVGNLQKAKTSQENNLTIKQDEELGTAVDQYFARKINRLS